MTEHNPLTPLLTTALEIYLEPRKELHCPHYMGTQELFLDKLITVGLCIATGEAKNMGLAWTVDVCMQGKPCPFNKGKGGDEKKC